MITMTTKTHTKTNAPASRWTDEYLFENLQEAISCVQSESDDPEIYLAHDRAIRDYLDRLHACLLREKHGDPIQDKIEQGVELIKEGQYFIEDGKRRQRERDNR
jgi:hypothetical protein